MNDFTKEELIKLRNGIDYLLKAINETMQYNNECVELFAKIGQMIDNYCEHKKSPWSCEIDYAKMCDTCDRVLEIK